MADQGSDPTQNLMGPEAFNGIREQWNTFLDQPGGRAALLSAGLALMQPPSFGDTAASQIGRAIGTAGEAVGRREAMDIKQQDAENKAALAEARIGAAGARSGAAAERLDFAREKLRAGQENIQLQQRVKLGIDYGRFRTAAEAENRKRQADYDKAKLLDPTAPAPNLIPIPTADQFIRDREQFVGGLGLQGGSGGGPVRVRSPEEARRLPSGTQIILPDGSPGTVP